MGIQEPVIVYLLGASGFLGRWVFRVSENIGYESLRIVPISLRNSDWVDHTLCMDPAIQSRVVVINCLAKRGGTDAEARHANFDLPLRFLSSLLERKFATPPVFINIESFWQYLTSFNTDAFYVLWKSELTRELTLIAQKGLITLDTIVIGHLGGPDDSLSRLFPRSLAFWLHGIGDSPSKLNSLFPYSDVRDVAKHIINTIFDSTISARKSTFPPHWIHLYELKSIANGKLSKTIIESGVSGSKNLRKQDLIIQFNQSLPPKARLSFTLMSFLQSITDTIVWIQDLGLTSVRERGLNDDSSKV